jgi:hypothetical protein
MILSCAIWIWVLLRGVDQGRLSEARLQAHHVGLSPGDEYYDELDETITKLELVSRRGRRFDMDETENLDRPLRDDDNRHFRTQMTRSTD